MTTGTSQLERLACRGPHADLSVVVTTAFRQATPIGRLRPNEQTQLARARWVAAACFVAAIGVVVPPGAAIVRQRGAATPEPIVFNDNGAWSWFEDERAVVDAATGTLLVGSVADGDGTGGVGRDGNIEVVAYDVASGTSRRTVLHAALEADDHNSPALFVRPDGRYVAAYSKHSSDALTRWSVSTGSGAPTSWGREATFEHSAPTTYSNLYATPSNDNRLYNFVRTVDRDPHFLVSDDAGSTWQPGGRLLSAAGRPYPRYAPDGGGRIHLITTEHHPHDVGTSVYHGVVVGNSLLTSTGSPVDTDVTDDAAVAPDRLTTIFDGDDSQRAWTTDIQIDAAGHPYVAFSVTSPGSRGNWYYFARFDGAAWHVHPLAHAGDVLYEDQPEYTGLVALDPHDPSRLVVSTNVDPATGSPLIGDDGEQHHELFEGTTIDGGATWSWTAITAGSEVDNIRPIIPTWDSAHSALLWLRGTYTEYQRYDLDVVGIIGR